MRQGNVFSQKVINDSPYNRDMLIPVPYELYHELESFKIVVWTDNRDGTFTLRFKNG